MAFYRGEEGSVKFSQTGVVGDAELIASTRSWSLTLDKAVLETTAMQDNYAGKIGSIISGSGTAEILYTAPPANETRKLIKQINTANDQGTAYFELYLKSNKKIVFDGVVTSADFSATIGEIEVVTVNFETNGTITTNDI